MPAAYRDRIYQGAGGQWRLTIQEKKRILLNNIYGVDIDPQAVEVTKLSLLLKVLEGETAETIGSTLRLFHERALPDLSDNIKCGNSLIGPDFYEGRQMSMFDEEERLRINAFDWHVEFPDVFKPNRAREEAADPNRAREEAADPNRAREKAAKQNRAREKAAQNRARQQAAPTRAREEAAPARRRKPLPHGRGSVQAAGPDAGFDAVIGNPPWISLSGKFGAETYSQAEVAYLIRRHCGNTYMPNMFEYFVAQGLTLSGRGGCFSFIVPDRLGFNRQYVNLRRRILTESQVVSLVYKVPFPGITADTLIFVFRKGLVEPHTSAWISEWGSQPIPRQQQELLEAPGHLFEYFENARVMQLAQRIFGDPRFVPLRELCDSTSGFGGKSRLITAQRIASSQIPTLKGDSIGRYTIEKKYWFDFRRENITGRTTDRRKLGAVPKILLRKTGDRVLAVLDDSGIFPEQSLYFLFDNRSPLDFRFLLGVLNSRFLTFYLRAKALTNRRTIAQIKKVDLDQLRMPVRHPSLAAFQAQHDRVVALVQQMLGLHKQLSAAKTPHEKAALQRQIDAMDRQIDQLVYDLYGLTEDEIKIVEEATQR